jgi:hypothetical protein
MDKSREAFEKWFRSQHKHPNALVAIDIWQAACEHQKEVDAKFKSVVNAHIEDLLQTAAVLDKYPQLKNTADEVRLAASELTQAIREQGE